MPNIKQTATTATLTIELDVVGAYPKANETFLEGLAEAIDKTVDNYRNGRAYSPRGTQLYIENHERGEFCCLRPPRSLIWGVSASIAV